MMPTDHLNLDRLAAETAQDMVNDAKNETENVKKPVDALERLATKALGVLQEQGVYAMMLFLFSRTSDEHKIARVIRAQLYKALKELPGFEGSQILDDPKSALKFYIEKVLNNLDTLLLVRDLYEQTLIYARYAAKAEEKGG
jgi:hypothetical protein